MDCRAECTNNVAFHLGNVSWIALQTYAVAPCNLCRRWMIKKSPSIHTYQVFYSASSHCTPVGKITINMFIVNRFSCRIEWFKMIETYLNGIGQFHFKWCRGIGFIDSHFAMCVCGWMKEYSSTSLISPQNLVWLRPRFDSAQTYNNTQNSWISAQKISSHSK